MTRPVANKSAVEYLRPVVEKNNATGNDPALSPYEFKTLNEGDKLGAVYLYRNRMGCSLQDALAAMK